MQFGFCLMFRDSKHTAHVFQLTNMLFVHPLHVFILGQCSSLKFSLSLSHFHVFEIKSKENGIYVCGSYSLGSCRGRVAALFTYIVMLLFGPKDCSEYWPRLRCGFIGINFMF